MFWSVVYPNGLANLHGYAPDVKNKLANLHGYAPGVKNKLANLSVRHFGAHIFIRLGAHILICFNPRLTRWALTNCHNGGHLDRAFTSWDVLVSSCAAASEMR